MAYRGKLDAVKSRKRRAVFVSDSPGRFWKENSFRTRDPFQMCRLLLLLLVYRDFNRRHENLTTFFFTI